MSSTQYADRNAKHHFLSLRNESETAPSDTVEMGGYNIGVFARCLLRNKTNSGTNASSIYFIEPSEL